MPQYCCLTKRFFFYKVTGLSLFRDNYNEVNDIHMNINSRKIFAAFFAVGICSLFGFTALSSIDAEAAEP
jgi:hypothetical protein